MFREGYNPQHICFCTIPSQKFRRPFFQNQFVKLLKTLTSHICYTPRMNNSPKISIIYARSQNFAFGHKNKLPWMFNPTDMKHFKTLTEHKTVIMGRSTFESLGHKPLPNRRSIVVTSKPIPGIRTKPTLRQALEHYNSEIFVIGGTSLIQEAMPMASLVFESIISGEYEADTFISDFDYSKLGFGTMKLHDSTDLQILLHYRHDS